MPAKDWKDCQKAIGSLNAKTLNGVLDKRPPQANLNAAAKLIQGHSVEEMEKISRAAACAFEFVQTVVTFYQGDDVTCFPGRTSASGSTHAASIAKRDPTAALNLNDTIVIEHCTNCKTHNTHTRHDEAKYANHAAQSKFKPIYFVM